MAIEAGKHVICEKPLEVTLDRVDQMINAAKKKDVKLACIFQGRWKEREPDREAGGERRPLRPGLRWAGVHALVSPGQVLRETAWHGTWKLDGGAR